jgi:hypothetical protein
VAPDAVHAGDGVALAGKRAEARRQLTTSCSVTQVGNPILGEMPRLRVHEVVNASQIRASTNHYCDEYYI